ncbi:MAG: putative secreted protein [Labilithrix sp.]|nr:putative secreted protein [Labilithrix sp.]
MSARRGRTRTALLVASIIAGAWVMSCYSATEIQLAIETDVPCDVVRAHGIAVFIGASSEIAAASAPVATTTECTPGPNGAVVGTLSIVPSGDRGERVFIDVVAGFDKDVARCTADTPGCIIARRAPRFIPHTAVRLPVHLSQVCARVHCEKNETCEQGVCVGVDTCDTAGCGSTAAKADDASVIDARADAACDGGTCAPTVVLPAIDLPSEIAIAGDDVYVTSAVADAGIAQCKTSGCAAPTFLVSQLLDPATVAADDTGIYYSSASLSLQRCDRPACTNRRTFNPDAFSTIVMNATSLYAVSQYNAYATRMEKGDGGPTFLNASNPLTMTIDSSNAYFYADNGSIKGLFKCSLTGCVPQSPAPQLLAPAIDVRSMAIDATHVYWAESDTGRVMRAAKDLVSGSAPITTTAKRPRSVVVDGPYVYWTDEGLADRDGVLWSASKNGDAPIAMATSLPHPYRLVIAGDRLFWTNRGAPGSVMSMPLR